MSTFAPCDAVRDPKLRSDNLLMNTKRRASHHWNCEQWLIRALYDSEESTCTLFFQYTPV